jgi:hypothetical protein
MHKATFVERRSGEDRRQRRRRNLKRFLRECLKPSTYRRRSTRRATYIRRDTYTVYLPG